MISNINGINTGLMVCFDTEFPEAPGSVRAELRITIWAKIDPFGTDRRLFGMERVI